MANSIDRRAALASIAAASAMLVAPAAALAATADDSEIIGLSAEILHRAVIAAEIQATQIDALQDGFFALLDADPSNVKECAARAFAYNRECGRETAIREHAEIEQVTNRLFRQLMAIRARTDAGRAAKVRALLLHVMRDDWRGPARELDWDKEMARALLGEFAGISAEELRRYMSLERRNRWAMSSFLTAPGRFLRAH
jgi:hypothetical protein